MKKIIFLLTFFFLNYLCFADINSDLIDAVKNHKLDQAKLLVAKGADVNYKAKPADNDNYNFPTPLISAVKTNLYEMVKFLLENKADVNLPDNNNKSALIYSLNNDPYSDYVSIKKIIELLLTYNADINIVDNEKNSALSYAIINQMSEIIELLLKHRKKSTDLIIACMQGDKQAAEIFINSGQLNMKDKNGLTGFYWASKHGFSEIVKLLLEKGFKLDESNNFGKNELTQAVKNRQKEVVEILLKSGASNCFKDKSYPIVHIAVMSNYENTEILKILLEKGADPNIPENTTTALRNAALNGWFNAVKILLEYKADPNIIDKEGDSPVTAAAGEDNFEIINLLKKYRAKTHNIFSACILGDTEWVKKYVKGKGDVNISRKFHPAHTPLIYALRFKHFDLALLLINSGADINKEANQSSPLYYACLNGDLNLVKTFFEKGAKINFNPNNSKSNPLYAAASQNKIDIINLLLSKDKKLNDQYAVYYAIKNNYFKTAELLIQNNDKLDEVINGPMGSYTYLIIKAAELQDKSLFLALIDKIKDINAVDVYNKTALSILFENINYKDKSEFAKSKNEIIDLFRSLEAKSIYLTPSVDSLRMRESPDITSKVIGNISKNLKLHFINFQGFEKIDNISGTWIKIRTPENTEGWCFQGYLNLKRF